MLRASRRPRSFVRSVYIPPTGNKLSSSHHIRRNPKAEELAAKQEAALLDAQLKELKVKQREFQVKIREARDRELQKKLAEKENAKLSGEASQEEIAALEKQLASPPSLDPSSVGSPRQISSRIGRSSIPPSINNLLPSASSTTNSIQLFAQPKTVNWDAVVSSLPEIPVDVPEREVGEFLVAIPLKERARLVQKIENLIPDVLRTQFVKDQIMAGYAELGRVADVKRIIDTCTSPTIYSYGHWAKSLFKTGSSPEDIFSVIKTMRKNDIEPSLPVMSNAIQSLIQHGRHKEAETMFDNMKYWSVGTQPDRKLYNSMILSSAKQHNVNRCLDLLTEMKERRPYPLQPDEETYNYVVYACARDPSTQIMAWELFLEARSLGYRPNLQSFRALLYLCGSSGEVLLSRALIRNLSETSPQFVDDYALNSLFLAYRNWQPGPSKILTSPSGQSIRANIILNTGNEDDVRQSKIPLLPIAQLDKKLILLESNAVFEYYADTSPQTLVVDNPASFATSPIVHNFLQVSINLGEDISEFQRRYLRFTKFAGEEDARLLAPEGQNSELLDGGEYKRHPNFAAKRDQYLYRLAIHAAIKFKDLEFGRQIWTERGKWRRLQDFRSLEQDQRNGFDFQFARDLVELLAVCGKIEEAVLLVKSTKNLRKWKKHHVVPLLDACALIEDTQTINVIMKIVRPIK